MSLKRSLIRITATGIAVTMLFVGNAFAAFDTAFSYTYQIGEGATYTRLEGKNDSGLQKANYIEYVPNGTVSPLIVYAGESIFGSKATISSASNYLKQQGYTPVGGINADFFVLGTSVPIGLVIKDGRLVSSDAWQYAVGFLEDGSAIVGQPSSTMKLEGPSGAVWISYLNKTRTSAGIYLLNSDFDDNTHISTNGRSIVLERLDNTPVTVGGQVRMKVIGGGAGNSPTTITANQMVLTMDDKCQATWVDFPVGEEVTLTVSTPDPRWNQVKFAVGGKSLVKDGAVSASGIDSGSSKTGRTAVGVKDDGTVIFYEIDGRQSSYSTGLTAAQLGNELKAMGYNNVICLDGGGSSAMSLRIPGEEAAKLISSPSDGSERACANYIFLVNKATPDGIAKHVHFKPSFYYILPGASTYFKTWGSDSSYGPASLPSGMTYTASSGTVDSSAQIFQSADTAGNVTISGTSADSTVTGSHTFCVTTSVDSIQLQSSGEDISAFSLRGGGTIDLDVLAYHQKTQMASKDSLFTWTVSGDIGTIDADGVFTAAQKPATGKITCSYGAVSASASVTVGLSDPQQLTTIADFESEQPFTADDNAEMSRVTETEQVARGLGAAKIVTSSDTLLRIQDTPTSALSIISLWAKTSKDSVALTAVFADATGQELTVPLGQATETYTLLNANIPEGAVTFQGIRVSGNSELYLDHILMSQRLVNNTDAPAIQLTKSPTAIDAGGSATVEARITMENGSYVLRASNVIASVDGVKSSAVYSPASGTISVITPSLQEGLHMVTIEAIDDAGNRARKNIAITAGSASASRFADTSTNWANGYINFAADRSLLQGEKSGGELYFNPGRNLKRSEFAVIMARYLGFDTSDATSLPFADASSIPTWAADSVKACYTAGIMNGQLNSETGKSNFNPNANITRAEVMTVISRILPRGYVSSSTNFQDFNRIPAWAVEHVRYATAAGLISGYEDGTIRPNHNITRAEIAKVLCGLY